MDLEAVIWTIAGVSIAVIGVVVWCLLRMSEDGDD